jgi:benzoylformate decarboxylase
LILMGDGIAASHAQKELIQLAEILNAEIYGVNNSEINVPFSHPLFKGDTGHMFGKDSQPITSKGDVILICGTTIMPEVFPLTKGVFADTAKIVHFDLNTYEIAKNFPVTIASLADPKMALDALSLEIKQQLSRKISVKEKVLMDGRIKSYSSITEVSQIASEHNTIEYFAQTLAKYLPPDAILFDEALTNSAAIFKYISRDYEGSYFQTRAGMLGTGLPGTIGLKLANPNRVVVGFTGDGGAISTIQALNTAARYNIGAKFIVCNNKSYRILKYNIKRYWNDLDLENKDRFPPEFDLRDLDFVKLSEDQGVKAGRIEVISDIEPVLQAAFANDNPYLIELILDKNV